MLFDETSAWLYNGKSKKEYIDNLANALIECIENPHMRIEKGENVKSLEIGDRVAMYWTHHRSYNVVDEKNAVKIAEDFRKCTGAKGAAEKILKVCEEK